MKTYFTSDLHFGHKNIIRYCNRPFETVEQMNEYMIQAWNSRVTDSDDIYVLGDFIFGKEEKFRETISQLRGRKILVRGNHDPKFVYESKHWSEVHMQTIIRRIDGYRVNMSHYRDSFKKIYPGNIYLHGHSHGSGPLEDKVLDVGVDRMGYVPLTIDEMLDFNNGLIQMQRDFAVC